MIYSGNRLRNRAITDTAVELPEPLVTRNLDPGLASDPKPLTFCIDLAEQDHGEIDIHTLSSTLLSGEVLGDIFTPFGTLRDLFDTDRFFLECVE